jgi:hypothetical protein
MSFAFLGNRGDSHHHKFLIREIVRLTGCQTYLELGVYDGETLDYVRPVVSRAIGVDLVDKRRDRSSEFYLMKTDDFFNHNKGLGLKFDVVFIDADHCFESAKKDFYNALDVLNEFGIIMMHDSDPISLEYTNPGYCGDSFRMIDHIIENHPELNIITLPVTETGISIIMRKADRRCNLYKQYL